MVGYGNRNLRRLARALLTNGAMACVAVLDEDLSLISNVAAMTPACNSYWLILIGHDPLLAAYVLRTPIACRIWGAMSRNLPGWRWEILKSELGQKATKSESASYTNGDNY